MIASMVRLNTSLFQLTSFRPALQTYEVMEIDVLSLHSTLTIRLNHFRATRLSVDISVLSVAFMPVTELLGNASIANTAFVQMVKDAWIQLRLDETALAGPVWL